MTGGLRVGVSARLAKTAVAELGGVTVDQVEEIWHGMAPPYTPMFAWLTGAGAKPETGDRPTFVPLMLANPLDEGELDTMEPARLPGRVEMGRHPRAACPARGGGKRIYSRTGDEVFGCVSRCRRLRCRTG